MAEVAWVSQGTLALLVLCPLLWGSLPPWQDTQAALWRGLGGEELLIGMSNLQRVTALVIHLQAHERSESKLASHMASKFLIHRNRERQQMIY